MSIVILFVKLRLLKLSLLCRRWGLYTIGDNAYTIKIMKLHLSLGLRKALLACMVLGVSVSGAFYAYGESAELTLPEPDSFTWIAGNGSGIGTGATADIVKWFAGQCDDDMNGWFGGTGQSYDANSYGSDISIIDSGSFSFKSRPMISGEYVALGVELGADASGITLSFENSNKAGYSLWYYDGTTATELVALTYLSAAGSASAPPSTSELPLMEQGGQIFAIWTANHPSGNAGGGADVTISNITLTVNYLDYTTLTWNQDAQGGGNIWSAQSREWTTTTVDGKTYQFAWRAGKNALFAGTGEAITVNGGVEAGTIDVTGTGWSWSGSTGESELPATVTATGNITIGDGGTTPSALALGSGVTVNGTFSLNGGTLSLTNADALGANTQISATTALGNKIEVAQGVTLNRSHLGTFAGTVSLAGSGIYAISGDAPYVPNLTATDSAWTGTVKLSGETTGLVLSNLGNANSTIDVEGTHSLADGNNVSSDITGGGTLQLGDSGSIEFQKDGGTVSAKITGSGNVAVRENTSFSNNVTAYEFAVDKDVSATTSAIVYATTVSGHIIGADAQSAQSVTTDRVAEHGTLVERTAGQRVTISNPTTLENVALGSKIKIANSDSNKLTLKGNIDIDGSFLHQDYFEDTSVYYAYKDDGDVWQENTDGSGNGYKEKIVTYYILEGQNDSNLDASDVTWTVDGKKSGVSFDANSGTVRVAEGIDESTYWVQCKDGKAVYMVGDVGDEDNKAITTHVQQGSVVMLKGGTLVFDVTTRSVSGMDMFGYSFGTNKSEMAEGDSPISTIRLTEGAVLKSGDFYSVLDGSYSVADGSTLVLQGEESSFYVVNSGLSLGKGIELGDDWNGIVYTKGVVAQGAGDLTALTNGANSTVQVWSIDTDVLKVDGHLYVADGVVLSNGESRVGGNMTLGQDLGQGEDDGFVLLSVSAMGDASDSVMGDADDTPVASPLALGSQSAAATLTVGGVLTTPGGILYNHAQSMVTAKGIGDSTLDVLIEDPAVMEAFGARALEERVVLVSLTDPAAATPEALLNGSSEPIEKAGDKYSNSVAWDGRDLIFTAIPNAEYLSERFDSTLGSANARSGAAMLGSVFAAANPQYTDPDGDLAKLLNAADNGSLSEEGFAAAAGSSTAALGMAFSGDVERQLRAIRNRTTSMGVNPCVVNEDMPYLNAWINAEGNMAELDQDGTMPGYTLDSWGGTVGFDVDVNPHLTLGMAVTAMYGDLTVDGPDMLEGDMDTYYVSAFARYAKRDWTHTFVATVGKMDATYERTVSHAGGCYTTEGDTDGTSFGLMYEAARTFIMDDDGDVAGQLVANVTYRHTTVSGYEETGRDAALKVDDQTLDTITFGVGGRMQAVVGENSFNRSAVFEARALAKLEAGDRCCEADVAFLRGGRSATVESAELGAFGVELGAGLSIPVGDENDGTIFLDVSAELRSGYSNVNGTLGYRINF